MTIQVAHITTIDFSLRHLLFNQLRSIRSAGYGVTGISTPGPDVPMLEEAGIRHIAATMTRNFTPGADLRALRRLVQIMRRERFTIVHTHNPKPGLLGQLAARMAGVPIVVNTLHGFYFHAGMTPFWRKFYIFTEKVAARCSDVILSQNAEDIATATQAGICTADAIRYLGNGIDITRFNRARLTAQTLGQLRHALGLQQERPVVGFVGRLVAEKGILELMEAARQVLAVKPTVQFLIIGPIDHEKPDALTPAIAVDYGVADAFTFTGLRHDMPELYALMDLFVLPSHREGFPRAPMEASAMCVPAIVTDIRGCREAVEYGRNGLLTPLGDVAALREGILTLLENPAQSAQMGAAGREMAETRFDEQFVFAKVKDVYRELLTAKRLA